MENDSQSNTNSGQGINFHSNNIASTKAKEKREIFVNVKQERSIENSVKSIQQKYSEIKTTAKNTIETQKKKIDNQKKKKIKKIIIIILAVMLLGGGGYLAYYLIKESQSVSSEKADNYLTTDPDKFISMYEQLIANTNSSEEKVDLLITRINAFRYTYGEEYAEQMLKDAYRAHEIYPSYTTANMIVELEHEYGSEEKANEWREKLNEYRGIEINISNG